MLRCVDRQCQCLFAAVFGHWQHTHLHMQPTLLARLPYLSWDLAIPSCVQRSACSEAQPPPRSGVRKPTCAGSLVPDTATCYSCGLESSSLQLQAFVISSLAPTGKPQALIQSQAPTSATGSTMKRLSVSNLAFQPIVELCYQLETIAPSRCMPKLCRIPSLPVTETSFVTGRSLPLVAVDPRRLPLKNAPSSWNVSAPSLSSPFTHTRSWSSLIFSEAGLHSLQQQWLYVL